MPVVHLILRRGTGSAQPPLQPAAVFRSVCAVRDGSVIAGLAADVAACDFAGAAPRAPGLLGELSGRPNRRVEAWLAFADPTATGRPAGFVSLTCSRVGDQARHSIGWLLVHPRTRRQGIGRALAAHACRRAWSTGAEEVWLESRADWAATLAFWEAVGFRRPDGPGTRS